MKNALRLASIGTLLTLLNVSSATAQSITCLDRTLGMVLNLYSTRQVAESWHPKTVRITDTTVQWGIGDNKWYPEVPNIGTDHLNAMIHDPATYKFKYNKNTGKLLVTLVKPAGYRSGSIYYKNCTYSATD
ncbi:MAG: hypothetical protein ACON4C_11310 [Henriciella sp.]